MPAGVIVAGGRSTRFGDEDKAVADLAGTPMRRRVADRFVDEVDELVVNCRDDQQAAMREALQDCPRPVHVALDPEPDRGPMAGIRTGLRSIERDTDAEYSFVVACDMPFVDPDLVAHLFKRAAGHGAAVPRLNEWFQTTHAVYCAGAMADACDRALADGVRKIIEPLFALDHAVVEGPELERFDVPDTFENVNTREEFEAAAERIS